MIATPAIPVIVNGSMSGSITSDPIQTKNAQTMCVQVNWTGATPIGTFELQESIDGTNWNILDGSVQNITGNSGTGFYACEFVPCSLMRLKYTRTSGTGTLQASIAYKGDPAI